MKRLVIRNIGPLKNVEIELAKVNVIVGPQSSGKSCVLKIACYCAWVEKKIELAQSAEEFMKEDYFVKELTRFHKLKGYFKNNSYIGYESDFTCFSYDAETKEFQFEWKEGRWDYRRPKVSYIPAERNMVAAIPNWFDVKFYDDNIQSFMADWDRARRSYTKQLDILNLGVSYKYDEKKNLDQVEVDEDTTLELTNTSSGLQSLIPLYVHLNYITQIQNSEREAQSYSNIKIGERFLQTMYQELFEKTGKADHLLQNASSTMAHIGPFLLPFKNEEYADECRAIFDRFVNTHHAEIFLEEPENNLFPPTQSRLVDWLLSKTVGEHGACLFVATHSPYMMTAFLEKDLKDFRLFLEKKDGKLSSVVTASEKDVQEIYDDGIDVYYNIESYT